MITLLANFVKNKCDYFLLKEDIEGFELLKVE